MSIDELELQLQVAEAELKTARLRLKVQEVRRLNDGNYNGLVNHAGPRHTD